MCGNGRGEAAACVLMKTGSGKQRVQKVCGRQFTWFSLKYSLLLIVFLKQQVLYAITL